MKAVLRRFLVLSVIAVALSSAILLAGCANEMEAGEVAQSAPSPPSDSAAGAGPGYGGPSGGFEVAGPGAPGGAPPPGGGMGGEDSSSFEKAVVPAASPTGAPPPIAAALPRKIIYTATVQLVVKDMSEAAKRLSRRVREMGGYVSGANLTGSPGTPRSGSWTIRLPVSRFEAFMNGVTDFGVLESSNTASQDVSEEFYDVEARLRNKRAEEVRLLEHLRRSTAKLSDILAVEREISRVREEIERMEGRLRFLANQTDLTTITISMTEERDYTPAKPATFMEKASSAFRGSREALGTFIEVVALLFVTLIPWLLVAAVVLIPLRLVLRRSNGKGMTFRPKRRGGDNASDADRDRYD